MKYLIYAGWLEPNEIIGYLYIDNENGNIVSSFEYEEKWLSDNCFMFDPEIELYSGRQYSNNGLFGFLKDISPDRWGRVLLDRNEGNESKKENRKARKLTDIDYLLGINDVLRSGGIRIANEKNEYLSNKEFVVPPLSSLRKIEDISNRFENNINDLDDESLKILLNPGSSLGGARPKANVIDENEEYWIAKFPSKNDDYDIEAFEAVALELASMCDINTPEFKLERYSKRGSTLLTKRFDRSKNKRIHYSSAMNLLGKRDGEEASYIEIADIITKCSGSPKEDLKELYKRIIFNMCISNTDDHLRNHGFILKNNNWRLSPVFDINPSIYGDSLSLSIDGYNKQFSFENALSVTKEFMLSKEEALAIIDSTKNIVTNNWKKLSKKHDISNEEIKYLEPAFPKE